MYTLETLAEINQVYLTCGNHVLTQADVNMANRYVQLIEESRSSRIPKAGDRVIYTTDFGMYYRKAHIEKVENDRVNICEISSVPFIHEFEDGIRCSSSGGGWDFVDVNRLSYLGTEKKTFCDWGGLGSQAYGKVEFEAEVSLWECKAENPLFTDESGNQYSTKDYRYMVICYSDKRGEPYRYFANGRAWKSEKELQAYLKTFRAKVFNYNSCQRTIVAWLWPEKHHHVSPEGYDKINGFEDSIYENGLRRCKRVYDTENHIVNTYFVWYWNLPEVANLEEVLIKQNTIIERYELPYKYDENMYWSERYNMSEKWYELDYLHNS